MKLENAPVLNLFKLEINPEKHEIYSHKLLA